MKQLQKLIAILFIGISSLIHFPAHTMSIDTEKLVKDAEGPLKELVRKIREENLAEALKETQQAAAWLLAHAKNQIQQAFDGAQRNLEVVTKSACRNLLYLGCGVAGLSILTTTVLLPIISQYRSSSQPDEQQSNLTRRYLPYAMGITSGIGLLVGSYLGLK